MLDSNNMHEENPSANADSSSHDASMQSHVLGTDDNRTGNAAECSSSAEEGRSRPFVPYRPSLTVNVSAPPLPTSDITSDRPGSARVTPASSLSVTPKANHQPTNVFVAGIPSLWDDKRLRERFQEFGDIVSVRVVPSRHFGFVMFRSPNAALAAIRGAHNTRPTPNCTALMHVALSMHDEGVDDVPNDRIFVRGLPQWATKEHLRTAFARFGTIVDCSLLLSSAGTCKGAGFVQYATVKEAEAAIEGGQTVKFANWDFELEVKFSETEDVRQLRQERNRERFRAQRASPGNTPTVAASGAALECASRGNAFPHAIHPSAASPVGFTNAPAVAYSPQSSAAVPASLPPFMTSGGGYPIQSPQHQQQRTPIGMQSQHSALAHPQHHQQALHPQQQMVFYSHPPSPSTGYAVTPTSLMTPGGIAQATVQPGAPLVLMQPQQFFSPMPSMMSVNPVSIPAPPFPSTGDLCFSSPILSDEIVQSLVKQRAGTVIERIALIDAVSHVYAVRCADRHMHPFVVQMLNNTPFNTGHVLSVGQFS